MGRSLVASPEGIVSAKKALAAKNLTQQLLGEKVNLGRTTIYNFFKCIPIARLNFEEICTYLGFDWEDIAEVGDKSLNRVWQKLQSLGNPTDKMGLVIVTEDKLRWKTEKPSPYEKSVKTGSDIRFEIDLNTSGYLLLLQKDTSGEVWCFCPSCFAPQPQLNPGKTFLPQEGSQFTSLEVEGEPGKEQILTVISQELPTFDWLPQENDDAFQLDESHLIQVIEYINQNGNCQVYYTSYKVTNDVGNPLNS